MPEAATQTDQQVIDFDAIFAKYMAGNQKVWEHDRSQSLGASEVFDCLRMDWYKKRGAAFDILPEQSDDASYGAMERGNIIENHFVVPGVRAGLPEGMQLLMAGDGQQSLILGKLSGTPDGLITGLRRGPLVVRGGDQEIVIPDIGADCIVFEIKSIDPRAVLLEERAKHHGQTQTQIGLIRELSQWKPRYSIILYVDASFVDKFTPFVVAFDEKIYAEAKVRADALWQTDDPMQIIPEGRFSGACAHCPFRGPCNTATIAGIPKFEDNKNPQALKDVTPLVSEYLRLLKEQEAAEQAKKVAAERVKECLLEHKTRKLTGDEWSVTWGPVKGKESLDTAAMEADGIDLSKYRKRGVGSDRLYVTPKVRKTRKIK